MGKEKMVEERTGRRGGQRTRRVEGRTRRGGGVGSEYFNIIKKKGLMATKAYTMVQARLFDLA